MYLHGSFEEPSQHVPPLEGDPLHGLQLDDDGVDLGHDAADGVLHPVHASHQPANDNADVTGGQPANLPTVGFERAGRTLGTPRRRRRPSCCRGAANCARCPRRRPPPSRPGREAACCARCTLGLGSCAPDPNPPANTFGDIFLNYNRNCEKNNRFAVFVLFFLYQHKTPHKYSKMCYYLEMTSICWFNQKKFLKNRILLCSVCIFIVQIFFLAILKHFFLLP